MEFTIELGANEKVFLITTSTGKSQFCNLLDIPYMIEKLGTTEGYYKVFHFWNNKMRVASVKYINEMLKAAGVNEVIY